MDDESQQLHKLHSDDFHLEVDDGGWLHGPDCQAVPSKRHSALWHLETNILGIVWHTTDTRSAGALRLAQRIRDLPTNGQRASSWHVCIDRAGEIVQSVSACRGSWHAGGPTAARFHSQYFGMGDDGKQHRLWKIAGDKSMKPNANDIFFGIELENVGEVRRVEEPRGEAWLGWPFRRGDVAVGEPTEVPFDEVEGIDGRFWHRFTDRQVFAAERVVSALALKYHLMYENCGFTHSQIDPQRRTDPGALWASRMPAVLAGFRSV